MRLGRKVAEVGPATARPPISRPNNLLHFPLTILPAAPHAPPPLHQAIEAKLVTGSALTPGEQAAYDNNSGVDAEKITWLQVGATAGLGGQGWDSTGSG